MIQKYTIKISINTKDSLFYNQVHYVRIKLFKEVQATHTRWCFIHGEHHCFTLKRLPLQFFIFSEITVSHIKSGWHCSSLPAHWSWTVLALEAGTLDRWEEKGVLEKCNRRV